MYDSGDWDISGYGKRFLGLGGVTFVSKFTNNQGFEIFTVQTASGLCGCFRSELIRKPKTPEQELREFLHLLWRENNEDFDDFADIAVLHLTKKGEGDE